MTDDDSQDLIPPARLHWPMELQVLPAGRLSLHVQVLQAEEAVVPGGERRSSQLLQHMQAPMASSRSREEAGGITQRRKNGRDEPWLEA